jgi:hypothetical protein
MRVPILNEFVRIQIQVEEEFDFFYKIVNSMVSLCLIQSYIEVLVFFVFFFAIYIYFFFKYRRLYFLDNKYKLMFLTRRLLVKF